MTQTRETESVDLTTVCHVRAPLLLEPIDEQIETLQACESEGAIDDLLIRSWPKEVALSEESPHQEVFTNYETLTQWADERGVTVRPPFRERSTTSQVTGKTRDLLVTPLLCLELYADDELLGVFPHSDETTDETYTTDEAIATLRTGELPTPLGSREPAAEEFESTTSTNCPDCGGTLIDGQGLFGCSDCGWVGTVTQSGRRESRSNQHARDSESPVVETR
ncbi:HTH domain-containing protein [Natrinema salinisoli]|uniref:HTH domain-containing protein n=1 Tax=Natrinema salinisoli TaxID=2878535 RepID=UPI001CEFB807|nr:HTH domain-containing protein [Natrinema salinisoli]